MPIGLGGAAIAPAFVLLYGPEFLPMSRVLSVLLVGNIVGALATVSATILHSVDEQTFHRAARHSRGASKYRPQSYSDPKIWCDWRRVRQLWQPSRFRRRGYRLLDAASQSPFSAALHRPNRAGGPVRRRYRMAHQRMARRAGSWHWRRDSGIPCCATAVCGPGDIRSCHSQPVESISARQTYTGLPGSR